MQAVRGWVDLLGVPYSVWRLGGRHAPEGAASWEGQPVVLGMVPSSLNRCTFPKVLARDWAFVATALSPAVQYSFPSGPKWMAPPLWLPALRLPSLAMDTALPGTATSPLAVYRTTRLYAGGPGSVKLGVGAWGVKETGEGGGG